MQISETGIIIKENNIYIFKCFSANENLYSQQINLMCQQYFPIKIIIAKMFDSEKKNKLSPHLLNS